MSPKIFLTGLYGRENELLSVNESDTVLAESFGLPK